MCAKKASQTRTKPKRKPAGYDDELAELLGLKEVNDDKARKPKSTVIEKTEDVVIKKSTQDTNNSDLEKNKQETKPVNLTATDIKNKSNVSAPAKIIEDEPSVEEPTTNKESDTKQISDTSLQEEKHIVEDEINVVPEKKENASDELEQMTDDVKVDTDIKQKPSNQFSDFFTDSEDDYHAPLNIREADRDLIRLIAGRENVNINSLLNKIMQAFINNNKAYFDSAGYSEFLHFSDEFAINDSNTDSPFSYKISAKGVNTSTRVSTICAENIKNIVLLEKKLSIHKVFAYSINWWKKQYINTLRKKDYYKFIRQYLQDVV